MTYDAEGRTVTENQTINISGLTSSAITKSISYAYNLDGSLKQMTYPSGRVVNYDYSTIGRTGSVADTGTGGANYLSWSPPAGTCSSDNQKRYSVHGEELCLNHGNGIISYNGFNKRFQPSLLSAAGTSGTVLSLSYTFTDTNSKNNGLLWKITNNKDTTRSQNFAYDQVNRIQSAWTDGNLWGNDFTVDPWGNLVAKAVHAGKPIGESLTATANNKNQFATYSYDNNGNLLNDQLGHAFTYDAENRPYSGGGVTYYYDGTGERVAKSSGKLYWFQDDNSPVAESDAAGNLSLEFIFANGKRLARRDANGTVHYYFSDQINSSNVITSADGSTVQSESDFYPYGGERVIVADSTGNNYKFTGKERDAETTNDYFGARYYSSNFGRFLTPDWAASPEPIPYAQMGIPQSLNLYSYVQNNPITTTDPDGHVGVEEIEEGLELLTIEANQVASEVGAARLARQRGYAAAVAAGIVIGVEVHALMSAYGKQIKADAEMYNQSAQNKSIIQQNQIKMSRGPESPQSEFYGVSDKDLAEIAKNHPDAQKRRRAVKEQKIRKQRNVAKRTGGKKKKKEDDKSKPGSDPSKPGTSQPPSKSEPKPEPKPNDPPDGGLGNHDDNLPSHDK